jgi:peptide/nickel transport system substrate-binding protein
MRARLALSLLAALAACSRAGAPSAVHDSTLRAAIFAEPSSLNPILATNTAESFLESLAFDKLVTIDAKGNDVPDLAAQVPSTANGGISKDGLTITYHLRHGVQWQDGTPFTSADVKFSWQAVMNPQNNVPERTGYEQVRSVDTPDPFTVVFHLKRPFAPFIDTVFGESDQPYGVLPAHLLSRYANLNQVPFNSLPIGTGPFKVTRWVRGDRIDYTANPRYFRGVPKLHAITVFIVPDGNTQESELRSHDVDLVPDIATANLNNLRSRPADGVTTMLVKAPIYASIDFNLTHPPLDDVRVRRALSYAVNEKRVIDTLLFGTGVPARADLADFYWAYDPNVTAYAYDPQKAGALLDAAGWARSGNGLRNKNGRPLSLQLVYGQGNATARQLGVLIQSDLRAVGVDVQIKTYTYTLLYATAGMGGILNGGKFDLAEYIWVSGADPDDSSGWTCAAVPPAGNNITHYCNPAFDAAENDAIGHFDRERRKRDYAVTQSLLASDAPAAFQYFQRRRYALSSALRNFTPNGISEGWNASEWSF